MHLLRLWQLQHQPKPLRQGAASMEQLGQKLAWRLGCWDLPAQDCRIHCCRTAGWRPGLQSTQCTPLAPACTAARRNIWLLSESANVKQMCHAGPAAQTARPSARAYITTFTADGSTDAHLALLGTGAAAAGTVAADVSCVAAPAVAMTSASCSVAGCCTAASAIA